MAGNFAIGCGVMVTAGSLNDLVRSLQVSVALGGQLGLGGLIACIGLGCGIGERRLWILGMCRRCECGDGET